MDYSNARKLNIGSGKKNIKDFTNFDGLIWDGNTNIIWNLVDTPYPFEDEHIEEIVCMEVLEHISWQDTLKVLNEFNRILKLKGKLHIQVPDCGKMMEYYVNNQICECVPHKDDGNGFKADPKCINCQGKGKVNPKRWLLAFTGSQKHKFDIHKNIFTKESLELALMTIGFKHLKFRDDISKLIVNCIK